MATHELHTEPISASVTKADEQTIKQWIQDKQNYWIIHGEYYDMRDFVARHPGGETFIVIGKGKNCTELFESVHCLSKINLKRILEKYKVTVPPGIPKEYLDEENFSWEENGFYDTLVKRVRTHFKIDSKTEKPQNVKSNFVYWFKTFSLIFIWAWCVYNALFSGSLVSAAIAGFIIEMLGFCVMHDGSHGALFKEGWKNIALMSIWNLWMLWCPWIWLRHHTYAHHSFTGIHGKDPDINNSKALIRKHEKTRWKNFYKTQANHFIFFLLFFPNQHFGQSIQYFLSVVDFTIGKKRSKIFGLPLEYLPTFWRRISWIVFTISVYAHFILPFYTVPGSAWSALAVIFVYWTCLGTAYFANVAPNHETLDTHETLTENIKKMNKNLSNEELANVKLDWGIQQVLSSANHSNSKNLYSTFVTHLWGGMNYQIEHHLFPAVCHVHYPEISKIVEQTAQEFGVEYVSMTWWQALLGYRNLLSYFSVPPSSAEKVKTS